MALKICGQARPGSGVTSTVYQVPVAKQAVVNVVICNTDAVNADSFILYAVAAAGSPTVSNAIYRGTVPAEESFCAFGIALGPGESLRMYAALGSLTCSVTGNES